MVHHETLIQYLKGQDIPKYLVNPQNNHLRYLVGLTIKVEVPPVTGCITGEMRKLEDVLSTLAD